MVLAFRFLNASAKELYSIFRTLFNAFASSFVISSTVWTLRLKLFQTFVIIRKLIAISTSKTERFGCQCSFIKYTINTVVGTCLASLLHLLWIYKLLSSVHVDPVKERVITHEERLSVGSMVTLRETICEARTLDYLEMWLTCVTLVW